MDCRKTSVSACTPGAHILGERAPNTYGFTITIKLSVMLFSSMLAKRELKSGAFLNLCEKILLCCGFHSSRYHHQEGLMNTADAAGGRGSSDVSFQRAAVGPLMLTLGVSRASWALTTRCSLACGCAAFVVISDLADHLQEAGSHPEWQQHRCCDCLVSSANDLCWTWLTCWSTVVCHHFH